MDHISGSSESQHYVRLDQSPTTGYPTLRREHALKAYLRQELNTGAVEVFRNMKDRMFQPIATKSEFGFWMGLAVGDIDNDGDQDLFFYNVGRSIPSS